MEKSTLLIVGFVTVIVILAIGAWFNFQQQQDFFTFDFKPDSINLSRSYSDYNFSATLTGERIAEINVTTVLLENVLQPTSYSFSNNTLTLEFDNYLTMNLIINEAYHMGDIPSEIKIKISGLVNSDSFESYDKLEIEIR